MSLVNLASVDARGGDYDRAIERSTTAASIAENAYGPHHPLVATALETGAIASLMKGDSQHSSDTWRRVIEIRRRALGDDDPSVASALGNLGNALTAAGRYDEADRAFLQAQSVLYEANTGSPSHLAWIAYNRGTLARMQGDSNRSRRLLRESVELWTRASGPDHRDLVYPLSMLAWVELERGDLDAAGDALLRARNLSVSGEEDVRLAEFEFLEAALQWESGRNRDIAWSRARDAYRWLQRAPPEFATERRLAGQWMERAGQHRESQLRLGSGQRGSAEASDPLE